jgi:hypothetical protein
MLTSDIITESHRRATDRVLRTLWQVEEDTGAVVELELREGGSRRRLMPDEPYDPPSADFDVLAVLEAELGEGPDDEDLKLLVELMNQQAKGYEE